MDGGQRRMRKYVLDYFLQESVAPTLEEISRALRIELAEARAGLEALDTGHHLKLLEGTSRILMAFPFSALATPYRVTLGNGRRYFANCAWDSVAFHPMLDEPIDVDSYCSHCGEPLSFRIDHGRATSRNGDLPLVHLKLPAAAWWNDITRTCANAMVFLGPGSLHPVDPDPATRIDHGIVTLETILGMSAPIYSGKLRMEYDRPPPSVVRAQFERLGLTGPYWKL